MDHPPLEYESDLVNVDELTLTEVMAVDDSVLGHALRRLREEADQPEELVAGWNSGI